MPTRARSFLKESFEALARLPSERYAELLNFVVDYYGSTYTIDEEKLSVKIEVSKDEAARLYSVATILTVGIITGDSTPEEVVKAAVDAKVLDEPQRNAALEFCKFVVSQRVPTALALKQSGLASRVLPALESLDVVVDLRFGFDKGRADYTVPVVLAYLDTDSRDQHVWFQMTLAQVERMIKDLRKVLEQLKEAQRFAEKGRQSKS
jgi:hypothetical protein